MACLGLRDHPGLLVILGLGTITWATVHAITNGRTYDAHLLVLTVGMGLWLPLSMFPFLYFTALFAALEKSVKLLVWFRNPPVRV